LVSGGAATVSFISLWAVLFTAWSAPVNVRKKALLIQIKKQEFYKNQLVIKNIVRMMKKNHHFTAHS
jgi:hypothetical protein